MTITRTDCTQQFYAHKDAAGFDDWCLSNGIGFEAKLVDDDDPNYGGKTYMSYIFEQKGLVFVIKHWNAPKSAAATLSVVFPKTVVEMLTEHPELINDIFTLQAKCKETGLDNQPLIISAKTHEECLERVAERELRVTQNKTALLKLYLSQDHTCGTYKKPGSFKNAFTFGGAKLARAYIDAEGLHLMTKSKDGVRTHEKYDAKDLMALLSVGASALLGGSINATSVDKKFLERVGEVYRAEVMGRSKATTLNLEDLDTNMFIPEEPSCT